MGDISELDCQKVMGKELLRKDHKLVVPNVNWMMPSESDLVSVTSSGYLHEYEIKTSRSDFRSEMRAYEKSGKSVSFSKVKKHRKLRNAKENDNYEMGSYIKLPSNFWIVAPEGIIDADELPDMWGLYELDFDESYYSDKVNKTKKAKRIHNEKPDKDTLVKLGGLLSYRFWSDGEWLQ